MRHALPLLCFVLVFCRVSCGEDTFKALPDFLYEGTYVLEWTDSKYLYSGLGTCVDLSKYGYNGRRAILTVYHVVSSTDEKAKDVQVSVLHNGKREIFKAKLVGWKEQVVVNLDPKEITFVVGMIKVHEEAEKRTSSVDFSSERK